MVELLLPKNSKVVKDKVVENNDRAGISILSPDAYSGKLIFGTFSDKTGTQLAWYHNDDLFLIGTAIFLFRQTIENAVDGFMVFFGNDYNEDDVVEIDGKPGRIVRVGIWKTVFFTYDVRDGKVVSGSKLVVANNRLKNLKIEKPLINLDLTKYKDK